MVNCDYLPPSELKPQIIKRIRDYLRKESDYEHISISYEDFLFINIDDIYDIGFDESDLKKECEEYKEQIYVGVIVDVVAKRFLEDGEYDNTYQLKEFGICGLSPNYEKCFLFEIVEFYLCDDSKRIQNWLNGVSVDLTELTPLYWR
ncbi:MAG: hypothetical protein AB4062_04335 [Crocosphaera sp.]